MGTKNQTLKNAHGGYGGRTLIQRLEQQMDKRRKKLEDLRTHNGHEAMARQNGKITEAMEAERQLGRYEGLAAAIAIMRSSSVEHEVERSNERLGIE